MQATTTPEVSLQASVAPVRRIGKVPIRSTKGLINRDTRLCVLCYSYAGRGKTRFGGTLDTLSKKHFGKPALFVALEAAEGGGTVSLTEAGLDVDIQMPRSIEQWNDILADLTNDTYYGAVVVDSATEYVNRFLKPHVVKLPNPKVGASVQALRLAGVPDRSDYQTMAELARADFNKLINLTTHPDPAKRKHLLVTALEKEKTDEEGVVKSVQPDLPGSLAQMSTAIFQTLLSLDVRTTINKDTKERVVKRTIATIPTETKILRDRTGIFPHGGEPDFVKLWEDFFLKGVGG